MPLHIICYDTITHGQAHRNPRRKFVITQQITVNVNSPANCSLLGKKRAYYYNCQHFSIKLYLYSHFRNDQTTL